MDILAKHYEKLILAFCLIGLLVGILLVSQSFSRTSTELAKKLDDAKRNVRGGQLVEKVNPADFSVERFFNDRRKFLDVMGPADQELPKGSLIAPNRLIRCSKEDCGNLIYFSSDVCPFCKTQQPAKAKETGIGQDTDNDGIPDKVENELSCLNYRDPKDARLDADGDGFLNIEEFKLETKIDDPDDFPPLGNLLRFGRAFYRPVPLQLVDLDTNRKEDMTKWDITVMAYDAKTRKMKRKSLMVGEKVNGMDIVSAGFTGQGEAAVPFIKVKMADEQEPYTFPLKKQVAFRKPTIQLYYLASREARLEKSIRMRPITLGVGAEFSLRKEKKDNRKYAEVYRLLSVNEPEKSAKVALLKAAKGEIVKEFTVVEINKDEDFLKEEVNRGMDGMEGPMDEMGPEGPDRREPPRGRRRPPRR